MTAIYAVYNDVTGKQAKVHFRSGSWWIEGTGMSFQAFSFDLAKVIARRLTL